MMIHITQDHNFMEHFYGGVQKHNILSMGLSFNLPKQERAKEFWINAQNH